MVEGWHLRPPKRCHYMPTNSSHVLHDVTVLADGAARGGNKGDIAPKTWWKQRHDGGWMTLAPLNDPTVANDISHCTMDQEDDDAG